MSHEKQIPLHILVAMRLRMARNDKVVSFGVMRARFASTSLRAGSRPDGENAGLRNDSDLFVRMFIARTPYRGGGSVQRKGSFDSWHRATRDASFAQDDMKAWGLRWCTRFAQDDNG